MVDVREAGACLRAAYGPDEPDRKPLHKSRNVKEAIKRLEQEASALEDEVKGRRPFSETLRDIVERMK